MRASAGGSTSRSSRGSGWMSEQSPRPYSAEAMVDLAAPRARHVREHPVEDRPARLVEVEPEVEEVAQEAPALRHPEGVGAVDAPGARVAVTLGAVAQVGGGVAHRQQARADDGADPRPVDHLVDAP